ncbi:MAG: Type 1 glutamine amidotransferase-like domain-containing protein [Patescibacteria group bacterium]
MNGPIYLSSSTERIAGVLGRDIGPGTYRVALITTGAEVEKEKGWLLRDLTAIKALPGWDTFEYTISGKTPTEIAIDLKDVDILYVAGGNVLYLLQHMQQSGFIPFAQEHVRAGKMYIGQSAGAIVAAPDISAAYRSDMEAHSPNLKGYAALNLVPFIVLPHWGSDKSREIYFSERLPRAYSEDCTPIPLNDYQYIAVKADTYRLVDTRNMAATIAV